MNALQRRWRRMRRMIYLKVAPPGQGVVSRRSMIFRWRRKMIYLKVAPPEHWIVSRKRRPVNFRRGVRANTRGLSV
jgi:hypothetical protein